MIDEIEQLITARGSRRKLKFLRDSLKETLREATVHHEELLLLLEDTDSEFNDHWIEELSLRVNTCFSEISGYLTEGENDTLRSLPAQRSNKLNHGYKIPYPKCGTNLRTSFH